MYSTLVKTVVTHLVRVGGLGGRDDLLVRRAWLAVADVVPDGAGEQDGFLERSHRG